MTGLPVSIINTNQRGIPVQISTIYLHHSLSTQSSALIPLGSVSRSVDRSVVWWSLSLLRSFFCCFPLRHNGTHTDTHTHTHIYKRAHIHLENRHPHTLSITYVYIIIVCICLNRYLKEEKERENTHRYIFINP